MSTILGKPSHHIIHTTCLIQDVTGPSTVLSSVEAVCSTYRDGFDLIQRIRAKRKARKLLRKECPQKDESIDDLERSLGKGNSVIRGEFDHDLERIGDSFGSGDRLCSTEEPTIPC